MYGGKSGFQRIYGLFVGDDRDYELVGIGRGDVSFS